MTNRNKNQIFPIFLNLKDKTILIVGGENIVIETLSSLLQTPLNTGLTVSGIVVNSITKKVDINNTELFKGTNLIVSTKNAAGTNKQNELFKKMVLTRQQFRNELKAKIESLDRVASINTDARIDFKINNFKINLN